MDYCCSCMKLHCIEVHNSRELFLSFFLGLLYWHLTSSGVNDGNIGVAVDVIQLLELHPIICDPVNLPEDKALFYDVLDGSIVPDVPVEYLRGKFLRVLHIHQ